MPLKDPEARKAYFNRWQRERKNSTQEYRQNPERRLRQRAYYLRSTYGITLDEYDDLYEKQNGLCAICGGSELEMGLSLEGVPRLLAVDHDHDTDRVRGLLCRQCNVGLGHFKDDPTLLRLAAGYLEEGGDVQ